MKKRAGDKRYVLPRDMLRDVIMLAEQGNFADASLKARQATAIGYEDVLWGLAEYYYTKRLLIEAVDLYQDIPEDNPHFQIANERLVIAIGNLLDAHGKNLTSEQVREFREIQFKCSLQANLPHLRTGIFNQLCDLTSVGVHGIENVGVDANTLLNVARFIKSQNKTLAKLYGKNAELLGKNTKLEKENDELKETIIEKSLEKPQGSP